MDTSLKIYKKLETLSKSLQLITIEIEKLPPSLLSEELTLKLLSRVNLMGAEIIVMGEEFLKQLDIIEGKMRGKDTYPEQKAK